MSTIQIDLTKQVKKMKPMHAGGQPPHRTGSITL